MAHHLMSRMEWIQHLKGLFDKHKEQHKKHDKLVHIIKKRSFLDELKGTLLEFPLKESKEYYNEESELAYSVQEIIN